MVSICRNTHLKYALSQSARQPNNPEVVLLRLPIGPLTWVATHLLLEVNTPLLLLSFAENTLNWSKLTLSAEKTWRGHLPRVLSLGCVEFRWVFVMHSVEWLGSISAGPAH